ncbi:ATP synthase F1 subcomplex epsilon subunit [Granulicella pectinivorans]|jgi:F-type H+-transporting ATPase subunit epsilon|uniref:ATP synthase epsilon chain n=1 Tax=Granulicella pectinivorans TaxID=474950 RepID=A0A1I6MP35_9BACT|nr:ATP synthase F1 subunit epsilon [Granulicella pectinivorans]SFS17450.1 ATP synthase F1 subcomplex epsilon subunit [Granulicella pectinivorans]
MAEAINQSGLLQVRLVTPDRVLLDATAEAVELPAMSGYLEALYGAAPLLAELGAGEVRLHGGSSHEQKFFVAWGFVEVLPERVTILAETAVVPAEIDKAAASAELQEAQKMWNEAGDNGDQYDEANALTRQAEEKIASAEGRTA